MSLITTSPARRALPALLLTGMLAACGGGDGGGTGPAQNGAVTLEITSAAPTIAALGDTAHLAAVARDRSGQPVAGATITWSTVGPVATVDADGIVTAAGNGAQRVVATTGRLADTVVVTVQQAPASVVLAEHRVDFWYLEQGITLGVAVLDARGVPLPFGTGATFESRVPAVAVVSGPGSTVGISARGNGQTWVVATVGDAKDSALVVVQQVAKSFVIDVPTLSLDALGATATLGYSAFDEQRHPIAGWRPDGFSVSDVSVASLDEATGVVTAKKNGTMEIGVRLGAETKSITVTVAQQAASIVPDADSLTFTSIDEMQPQVTARAFDRLGNDLGGLGLWGTLDCDGCVIGYMNGQFIAKANGRAHLTFRADNGVSRTIPLIVKQRAATVTMGARSYTLMEFGTGSTVQASATAKDAHGYAIASPVIIWRTSDESTFTVDATGLLSAANLGTATLSATVDGVSATATVTVKAAP